MNCSFSLDKGHFITVIIQKLKILRNIRISVYEFLADKFGVKVIDLSSNFKIYCKK